MFKTLFLESEGENKPKIFENLFVFIVMQLLQ